MNALYTHSYAHIHIDIHTHSGMQPTILMLIYLDSAYLYYSQHSHLAWPFQKRGWGCGLAMISGPEHSEK